MEYDERSFLPPSPDGSQNLIKRFYCISSAYKQLFKSKIIHKGKKYVGVQIRKKWGGWMDKLKDFNSKLINLTILKNEIWSYGKTLP